MATTYTVGTAGRTYSTIAAAIAAIPNPPTGGYIIELYNDSQFTEVISVSGFTTSATDFIKVTTGAGQSFLDNAGATTNAQFYDQSKGVGTSVALGAVTNLVSITCDYVTVEKIQFKATAGNLSSLVLIDFSCDHSFIKNCIGARTYADGNNAPIAIAKSGQLINSLFYQTVANSSENAISTFSCTVVACAFINLGSAGTTVAINNPFGSGATFIDCTLFGWGSGQTGTDSVNYCATDLASGLNGSNNVYSLALTTEYQGTSDFRLKSGHHMAAGQRQNTYTSDLDIVGQARSTSTPCIGQWEFVSGAVANQLQPWQNKGAVGVMVCM